MRLGRPSLGPIDHPMIAVPSRGGCKQGEIRTRTRFRIPLTPHIFPLGHAPEEPLLLRSRPKPHQYGATHIQPERY